MAKFEIEAKIGANSAEFNRKMREASAESREFAKKVKENVGQVKEVFGEVAGEAGLGKIARMFGSATAAAGIFGAAIAAVCIDGVKEFAKLEDQAFKFGQILHDKGKGMEVAKEIEEMPGHMGNKDEMNAGMVDLLEGYKALGDTNPVEKATAMMKILLNATAQTGGSFEAAAKQWRVFVSGGEEAEKSGSKLAKGIPQISALLEEQNKASKNTSLSGMEDQRKMLAYQLQYTGSQSTDLKERQEQLEELDKQIEAKKSGKAYNVSDELKKFTPAELNSLLAKEFGPSGQSGHAADEKGDTTSGKFQDLTASVDRAKSAIGEEMAPTVKMLADELTKEMPDITDAAHTLGEALRSLTPAIKSLIEFIDGHTLRAMGTDQGERAQRSYLETGPSQMRFDANGNPLALTPVQRDLHDQTKIRGQIANNGESETNLFGSRTGGKDLQQEQLDAMNKIEKNTSDAIVQ